MAMYNEADFTRKYTKSLTPEAQQAEDLALKYRPPFRKGYGRLIHCGAFRRLQGKTQLFPSYEDDFFRNRLTHSMEVAQIAKGIASRLNLDVFSENIIDIDLIEFAALAHDLGHPPFGHNGEEALDECMKEDGGFEGNAQTLRILSRLEKKQTMHPTPDGDFKPFYDGRDVRCGLNLTARSLAAILKYDTEIPSSRPKQEGVTKGYYACDKDTVDWIKKQVSGSSDLKETFKTIECSIMDIADDIAYSTYDLEDTFKAGFTDPLQMIASPIELLEKIAIEVNKKLLKQYTSNEIRAFAPSETGLDAEHVRTILIVLFQELFEKNTSSRNHLESTPQNLKIPYIAKEIASSSLSLASNGYKRTALTSDLVRKFSLGINVQNYDAKKTWANLVKPDAKTFIQIEVLKKYNYLHQITGSRLQITAERGKRIVEEIFNEVVQKPEKLLPGDFYKLYELAPASHRNRVVCDFVAGMTDRYAVEYHARLYGSVPPSIYKPF